LHQKLDILTNVLQTAYTTNDKNALNSHKVHYHVHITYTRTYIYMQML